MFKFLFLLLIIILAVIIFSGDIVGFEASKDLWTININHQELISSLDKGITYIYDFFSGLIDSTK